MVIKKAVTKEALNTFEYFPCREINSLQGWGLHVISFPPGNRNPDHLECHKENSCAAAAPTKDMCRSYDFAHLHFDPII